MMTTSPYPKTCPRCGARDSVAPEEGVILCRRCGQLLEDDATPQPDDAQHPTQPGQTRYNVSYYVANQDELDVWSLAAYHSALAAIERQENNLAISALRRAVEGEPNFTEALLWLGRLLPDPAERRAHLQHVLALNGGHAEATKELMVMDGELTPQDAAQYSPHRDAAVRETREAVPAALQRVRCPRCGSPNATGEDGAVTCASCGHVYEITPALLEGHSLTRALVRQRAGLDTKWQIGEHLLHCEGCGAMRTIPAGSLAETCPFCGSRQVLRRDALGSFREPDALLAFAISREEAQTRIRTRLASWEERLQQRVAPGDRIASARMQSVYLPYWVFTGTADPWTHPQTYLMAAVRSPSRLLTAKLAPWDLSLTAGYRPELLADHSAELYDIDFDTASIEAFAEMGGGLAFRLVLMPVWSATLLEKDGDMRLALVNGQSGKVAIARARPQ